MDSQVDSAYSHTCKFCQEEFNSERMFRLHQKREHDENLPFI
jgi:hypothetical protein